jgi:hypothetical protein
MFDVGLLYRLTSSWETPLGNPPSSFKLETLLPKSTNSVK